MVSEPMAIQQIAQAVIESGDQQQDSLAFGLRAQLPFHSELPGNDLEPAPRVPGALFRERDTHSHEEAFARDLVDLRGLDDVAAIVEQTARDIGHDAGHVAARQSEDVLRS